MADFKKSGKRRNVRKREVVSSSDSGSDQGEGSSTVVRGDRKALSSNPLKAATCSVKKLKEDREALLPTIQSTKKFDPEQDSGATKIIETETSKNEDATAIYKRNLELSRKDDVKEEYKEVYRGSGGYQKFIEVKDTVVANAGGGQLKQGPIRRPDHLRATVRWDYAPDICKDFKETGFCGFGDSCKFMHDRTDYKSGWQLEREWQTKEYGAHENDNFEVSDSDDDDIPFACYICREHFTDPVVTKCLHYFCETCALKHFKKTKRCFVCEKNTGGIFNPAKVIIAKMKAAEEAGPAELD